MQADGYFDHIIPYTNDRPVWEWEIYGWSWSELTTESYQAVFYGIRGPEDGYGDYTHKHLTLIDRHTGKVIAEYSGDEVSISEGNKIEAGVKGHIVERPASLHTSAPDLDIFVSAQSVVLLDRSSQEEPVGFVDFMASSLMKQQLSIGEILREEVYSMSIWFLTGLSSLTPSRRQKGKNRKVKGNKYRNLHV